MKPYFGELLVAGNRGKREWPFIGPIFHRASRKLFDGAPENVTVLGVEGLAWMLPDFDSRWLDPALRRDILEVARSLESEPSIVGVSARLFGMQA